MPKCIPYESSLVLGQVIDVKKIEAFESIAKAESSTDDEEKKLNNLLKAKLEMENTIFQVKSLGIDVSSLKEELENMDNSIKHAASAVVHAQIDAYRPGGAVDRALKCADHEAHVECPASPIDFCRSNIKTLPLSNDSIVFDSKYFSFDHNEKTSHSNLSYLKTFISSSVKYLGRDRCNQITSAVAKQATSQIETHDVVGTLVITATATHEEAKIFSPLVLDVEKCMHVWNELYPEDSMYEHDPAKCAEYACMDECSARDGNKIHILTGMTTGSSFIGMVHILRSEKINVEQKMSSISCYIQKQMEKKNGCGYNKNSGGHGIDSSFLTDVKKILSTQQIYSHCSMVSVGCIPSIKSKQVQVGVKQLSSFDASTVVDQLTTLATCTNKGGKSQLSEEDTARIGRQMGTIRGEEIQSVIHSLGKIDDGQNNMLDVNSLMICFEDYVNKAAAGKCGVPIKFYVDSFTKKRIARDWLNCYYPHCPPESRKPKGRRHCGIY